MSRRKNLYNKAWTNIIKTTQVDSGIISNYRKVFILIFLIIFFPSADLWIANIPDALYQPPRVSLATFFTGYPSVWMITTMNFLIVSGLILVGINRFSVIAGLTTVVLLIIKLNFSYSIGKIDHNILLVATLFCFTLSDWKSKKDNEYGKLPIPPETLLGIFIAFGMFTAGFQKAFAWVDFDLSTSGFLAWFNPGYYVGGRDLFLAELVLKLPQFVIECFDYFAVIFELSAIVILFTGRRKLWRLWLLCAVFFHIANILLLNISFLTHLLVYLPFLLPPVMSREWSKTTKIVLNALIFLVATTQLFLMMSNKTIINWIVHDRYEALMLGIVLLGITFLVGLYTVISQYRKKSTI